MTVINYKDALDLYAKDPTIDNARKLLQLLHGEHTELFEKDPGYWEAMEREARPAKNFPEQYELLKLMFTVEYIGEQLEEVKDGTR